MQTVTRKLINLDMLLEDLLDASDNSNQPLIDWSDSYLKLLKQYLKECQQLLQLIVDLKEHEFVALVGGSGACSHIKGKRMLGVQIRLIEYVIDVHVASVKVARLQASEFDDYADKRLNLLQTKIVKARSQFKTVAKAMGEVDLHLFISALGLPVSEWGWYELGLDDG